MIQTTARIRDSSLEVQSIGPGDIGPFRIEQNLPFPILPAADAGSNMRDVLGQMIDRRDQNILFLVLHFGNFAF